MAKEPARLMAARPKLGTREASGAAKFDDHGLAKRLGTEVLGVVYNAHSKPWCGVFVAACMQEDSVAPPPITARAKAWATWGQSIRPERIAPGAVLVFKRAGGGHVVLYVGEDPLAYHVHGDNQGDWVSVTRIDKGRCIARRCPAGRPVIGGPVKMNAAACRCRG